jgi:hypothetical protein
MSEKCSELNHTTLRSKNAAIAICMMLLTTIYSILKKSEAYNPTLYRKKVTANAPANRIVTVKQALTLVKRHGFIIVDAEGELAS